MRAAISQDTLRRVNRWKFLSLLGLLVSLFLVLITVENLLVSSLFAFVISYTLGPAVSYLERQGVSRALASSIVFLAMGLALGLLGVWIFPYLSSTLNALQSDTPRLIAGIGHFITEIESKLRDTAAPLSNFDLTSRVESQLTEWTQTFFERLPLFLKTFLTVMVLGPFLAFFMIKDGRWAVRALLGLTPNHLFETVLSLQHQINFQIGQFVRARLLESVIVSAVTAVGLLMISFPYALLLGIVAGLTNLIPYLGPLLGAVPASLIALVNGYSSLDLALVALIYVVAQAIDAGILIPLMVAKIVDLHPVTVIVVIIAGAQLLGILGMIISIPVAATLKVTISTVYRNLIDTRS